MECGHSLQIARLASLLIPWTSWRLIPAHTYLDRTPAAQPVGRLRQKASHLGAGDTQILRLASRRWPKTAYYPATEAGQFN